MLPISPSQACSEILVPNVSRLLKDKEGTFQSPVGLGLGVTMEQGWLGQQVAVSDGASLNTQAQHLCCAYTSTTSVLCLHKHSICVVLVGQLGSARHPHPQGCSAVGQCAYTLLHACLAAYSH